jgi:hypothetical protein
VELALAATSDLTGSLGGGGDGTRTPAAAPVVVLIVGVLSAAYTST